MIISADHQTNPVYFTAEVREIERLAAALPEAPQLMEKAGFAAAEIARDKLLIHGRTKVLVLAGPETTVGTLSSPPVTCACGSTTLPWYLPAIATTSRMMHNARWIGWVASGGEVVETIPSAEEWDTVIDGLLGSA